MQTEIKQSLKKEFESAELGLAIKARIKVVRIIFKVWKNKRDLI